MVLALPVEVDARGIVDTGREVSLTLDYKIGGRPMRGMKASIYQVATINTIGEFTLTGSFKDYPVKVYPITEMEEWEKAAEALTRYAIADRLVPLVEERTNAQGLIQGQAMVQGLYLVITGNHDQDGWRYAVDPFLISLPDAEPGGDWLYDVYAIPKLERVSATYEDLYFKLVKYWVDEGHETERPDQITVEIFKDRTLVYTKSLGASNLWSFSWVAPDDGSVWRVVEKELPKDYQVSLEREGNFFGLTNSWIGGGVAPPQPPQPTETTKPTEPTKPIVPTEPTEPTLPPDPPQPPVTGESMSPVLWSIFFVLAGLALAFLGWQLRRSKDGK